MKREGRSGAGRCEEEGEAQYYLATLERKGGMRVNAYVELGADYPHEQALFRLDF